MKNHLVFFFFLFFALGAGAAFSPSCSSVASGSSSSCSSSPASSVSFCRFLLALSADCLYVCQPYPKCSNLAATAIGAQLGTGTVSYGTRRRQKKIRERALLIG